LHLQRFFFVRLRLFFVEKIHTKSEIDKKKMNQQLKQKVSSNHHSNNKAIAIIGCGPRAMFFYMHWNITRMK